MDGSKDQNLKVSDDSTVQIPLRNLVGLLFGTAVGVLGYAELNSRITTLEYQQTMQDMVIEENSHFVTNWPLGRLGALPDDLQQTSAIEALEKRQGELEEMRTTLNDMQIEINKAHGVDETQNQKIESIFTIWNNQLQKQ